MIFLSILCHSLSPALCSFSINGNFSFHSKQWTSYCPFKNALRRRTENTTQDKRWPSKKCFDGVYSWDNSISELHLGAFVCVFADVSAPRNMIKYSEFFPIHPFTFFFRWISFFLQVVFLWFLIWICVALNLFKGIN